MKRYFGCVSQFHLTVQKPKKERPMMTTEFKLAIYESALNENEKKYLANIANQYASDENMAKVSKKTAGAEQVLQKLVKA